MKKCQRTGKIQTASMKYDQFYKSTFVLTHAYKVFANWPLSNRNTNKKAITKKLFMDIKISPIYQSLKFLQ